MDGDNCGAGEEVKIVISDPESGGPEEQKAGDTPASTRNVTDY